MSKPPASERYEIQARRMSWRNGEIVRDEASLDRADTLDDAVEMANRLAADGFTVWVYSVEPGDGFRPRYHFVQRLEPRSAAAPIPHDRTRDASPTELRGGAAARGVA